jgi:uncharacterized membrane protein
MSLLYPQALLLWLPLGLWLWRGARLTGPAMGLRVALVALLGLALARPELDWKSGGSDVVVVVDRSKSMPPGSSTSAEELIRLLEPQRRPGDRLGVVSFGRDARVELALTHDGSFGGFQASLDAEASNLSNALDTANELFADGRAGRVLVLSDGRATGLDARAAARRLAARGIPVDYRWIGREDSGLDVAVTNLEAPPQVAVKEPFQLAATLRSTANVEATLTLRRNGVPLAKVTRQLRGGDTVVTFRDLVEAPGVAAYQVTVDAKGDGVVENDVGRALTRVEGPPRVLVLTDHPNGTLVNTLRGAELGLEVSAPHELTMSGLDGVGAVVLEDVEASRLTENGLHVLAQYVKEAGGGLVMTGGRHSFGEGGYRKSPVEDVLPVSLEVREEQRKAAVAISIIMDCSCSMGARIPDGRTKMELAAEGVVGALQLLNERDEASVHMVDTNPHEIFGLSSVAAGLPLNKVARGFSGGGGIYIGVGLRTGLSEILKSSLATRHVLLFSDAADSEQPDDYQRTIDQLTSKGVTVSVIGMGTRADSDAKLLEEIAQRGNGRIYFADDVTSLPRIFSQETIAVARSTFVDTATPLMLGPDLALLGKLPASGLTRLGGYNLTYLRPQASVGLRTDDGNKAPTVAFWPRGAGRVVAFTGEVDGEHTGEFKAWSGRRALLEQMVRWTLPPQVGALDAVPRATVQGNDLHVTLDFDLSAPLPAGAPTLVLLSGDARSQPIEVPMRWEDEDRVGAHFTLPGSGNYHPVVKLGDKVFRAPPVTLAWAPEFEPGSSREGKAVLAQLAKVGGGLERLAMAGLFMAAPESLARVPLAPVLVALCVALLLAEVFTRRFFAGRPRRAQKVRAAIPIFTPGPMPAVVMPPSAPSAPPPKPPPPPAAGVDDALAAARERAKKRTGR